VSPTLSLNDRAWRLTVELSSRAEELRVAPHVVADAAVYDFGIAAPGGIEAGLLLARLCMADLGRVALVPGRLGERDWPAVQTATDAPFEACLLSQYAGWQIACGDYFAMGSGPMRAAAAREELFRESNVRETPCGVVGVLEGRKLPTPEVISWLTERTGVPAGSTVLAIAPTASLAGTVQVVARSVETALHKLHELNFDVRQIVSGAGTAPLPPVARDDLRGIGWTNDSILYGARVDLWVRADDAVLADVGPRVPACSGQGYGAPFFELFEAAGRDFYKLDPRLFSPAVVRFFNLSSGRTHTFGRQAPEVLARSFGL